MGFVAKELVFTNPDKFALFMDGFLGTNKESNNRLAAKVLDKIDTISEPKFPADQIDQDQPLAAKLRLMAERKLKPHGGSVVLEDNEFAYALECFKAAGWKNWAAKAASELEIELEAIPTESFEKIMARRDGILELIKDAP